MKFGKTLVTMVVALGFASAAQADSGRFNFIGQVADTPCSVIPGSLEKDFDFGILSQASLNGGGQSHAVTNTVELTNCNTGTKDTATFAFSGAEGHSDEVFNANGVDNLGIKLTLNNTVIKPNTSISHQLVNGTNYLTFEATAVGAADGTDEPVGLGTFNSVATFSITYS